MPLSLSIVIPSHRRADLLRLCLASVARYAPLQTEVIVVDDGSPGGAISQAASEFPGVKVIRQPRAGGFCIAANAGIAAATAPVVELLNDDAEVTEGWATAALRWFADERIAAVAPLILQNDPNRLQRGLQPLIDSAGDEYDPGGFAIKRGHGRTLEKWRVESGEWRVESEGRGQETGNPIDIFLDSSVPSSLSTLNSQLSTIQIPGLVWGASAAAAFYLREAVIRVGGFPKQFRAYFEDVDLSFRLRRLGFEIVYDPGSVVWHRVSSSYGRKPSRRVLEQQSCNEERVFWRNVRGMTRARWLPRHAVVLMAKALKRFQEGTLMPWLLGRVRAIAG
ncbi:MAG TPA: glycosyltransferase family 2 protein [Gemmata sp.]|jgi:GT2 family glycosyltransferase|nr:glycosyltransferase family 2 protein [Gemmata sp.]